MESNGGGGEDGGRLLHQTPAPSFINRLGNQAVGVFFFLTVPCTCCACWGGPGGLRVHLALCWQQLLLRDWSGDSRELQPPLQVFRQRRRCIGARSASLDPRRDNVDATAGAVMLHVVQDCIHFLLSVGCGPHHQHVQPAWLHVM